MDANTETLEGRSFSETLAQVRLGQIDAPVSVLIVNLSHDLIVVDYGDADIRAHESRTSTHVHNYTSAGELADVITEDMANWGTRYAVVWFAGDRVHYSHHHAATPWHHAGRNS